MQATVQMKDNILGILSNVIKIGEYDINQRTITTFNVPNSVITYYIFDAAFHPKVLICSYFNTDRVDVASAQSTRPFLSDIRILVALFEI